MTNLKQPLMRYWLAMNASAIQSTAHAGKAFLAIAVLHTADTAVLPLNWKQLGAVLVFSFIVEIFNWLDKNPLPQPVGDEVTSLKSKPESQSLTSAPTNSTPATTSPDQPGIPPTNPAIQQSNNPLP